MSCYKDLLIENQELREQLIVLTNTIRRVRERASDEDLRDELGVLLRSVPTASLSAFRPFQ